jgi:hypothetical protein
MADKEMIAATLAAAAISLIDFSRSTDQKALIAHEAAIAVNVYEAIWRSWKSAKHREVPPALTW